MCVFLQSGISGLSLVEQPSQAADGEVCPFCCSVSGQLAFSLPVPFKPGRVHPSGHLFLQLVLL